MKDTLLPDALVNRAREVVEANRAAGRRVAIAESCTGGLVCAALTEIPGSSEMFEAGYVTYSNAAKISELKVSEDVVDTFGAVSVATAWAMARGALAAADADVAVAITGIAGPGGGTAQFMEHQFQPQLRGLVLDDEQQLIVVFGLADRLLRTEQGGKLQVGGIAHP